jgi:hypothetical protein
MQTGAETPHKARWPIGHWTECEGRYYKAYFAVARQFSDKHFW